MIFKNEFRHFAQISLALVDTLNHLWPSIAFCTKSSLESKSAFVQHTEVLQVQAVPKNGSVESTMDNLDELTPELPAMPWHWFGVFQADPQWGQLFDEIEQQRDEHLIGG